MASVEIVTFGCRLNAFESDVIRDAAVTAGLADAVIVNTCAVTEEAERQARQTIRRARRDHPGRRIVVTGCAATLAPARYGAMPEVDLVLDNEAKLRPESYAESAACGETESASGARPAGIPRDMREGKAQPRARAYLQVQQGCDHRCTFCIIPFARGASRSVPIGLVAERARALVAGGAREIVLTGVDLTAYGADLPGNPSLGQMARRLLASVPELERLRFSSLDPSEIDDGLWRLIAEEPRVMPHLHLSLQAGDDLILKRMKRRHSRAGAVAVIERARALRSDIAIGADLIAGFPTETEKMFRNSLDLIGECGIAFLHVFPYSRRPGTPAARMPQVCSAVVRERAARLRAAGAAALHADLSRRVGAAADVLVEARGRGRAPCYAPVEFADEAAPGTVRGMRFVAVERGRLLAEALP
jgi:threonylcarbamoyladenosine tRNA methylthiotransferase MtaB